MLKNFVQARNYMLTNVIVSYDHTIEYDIKSQETVHPSSIGNHAHKITWGVSIYLN